MQRKISNIKYKLHSIPILSSSLSSQDDNNSMKNKSNVLYSIPCIKACAHFCRKKYNNDNDSSVITVSGSDNHSSLFHHTSYLGARSRRLPLQDRAANSQPSFRTPCGKSMVESISLSSIKKVMPLSRISSCSKVATFTFLLLSISLLSSIMLGSGSCYAASASLTLGTTGTISSNATAGSVAYASNTIKASASDIESYTLSITGPVGLSSNSGGTTITGANNNKPSTMPNNSWGYSYNEDVLSNDNKTYKSFTGSAQTLESGTTPSNTAKNITFAAKFGEDAISGHYKANIILSLVATPATTTYTITYNANGGTGAPSSTTCTVQGVAGSSCTTTLSSTKPTRTNYTFLGWSTSSSTATSASYSAGGSISISKDTQLYAVWKVMFNGISTMQEMTNEICAAAMVGDTTTLRDSRDDSTYHIRKHEDQRCWMMENLRIINKTLNSTSSNVSSDFTIPKSDISGFTSGNRLTPQAYVSGNTGYYNHYASVAGDNYITNQSSICPKGWRLPLATGNTMEAQILYDTVGSAQAMMLEPYNFSGTGYISSSGSVSSANEGFWWLGGSAANSSSAYYMTLDQYDFGASSTSSASRGYAVRCIAI